jgi:hypothetical protein
MAVMPKKSPQSDTVYGHLCYIKSMTEAALEKFDELAAREQRSEKAALERQEVDLQCVLAAITGCGIKVQSLLKKGRLR